MPSPAHVHAAYSTASEASVPFKKNSTLPNVMAVTENHSERLRESTPQQTAQGEHHQQNGERDAHEVDDDADQPGIGQHVIAVQVALNPDTHHRKAEKASAQPPNA